MLISYQGPIAEAIVKEVQSNGGILTMDDMVSYVAKVRDPLIGFYHGRKIITSPAPTR